MEEDIKNTEEQKILKDLGPQPEESKVENFFENKKKDIILSLDFDGVIHKYSEGWKDGSIYDEQVTGAIEFIAEMMWKHQWSVFVMSTRNPHQIKDWFEKVAFKPNSERPFKVTVIDDNIQQWTEKCNLGITNRKLQATMYVDDRAITFDGNFEELFLKLQSFKTWMNRL